jgi:DHA2 family multidrug resistance protein
MGGEIGTAFIASFTRMRTQTASNLIGQHVRVGDAVVVRRLSAYAAATGGAGADPGAAAARGAAVLTRVVRSAAATQGVIDGFVTIGALTAVALILVVAHSPAPMLPASYPPLFKHRPDSPA